MANKFCAWNFRTWCSSVYDEAKAVVKKNKATPEEVEVQLTQYRKDGLPEDKRFNGKKGLPIDWFVHRE